MTGYPADEVVGQNPRILKSGRQDSSVYQALWNTILSGEVWRGELTNRRKDGTFYTEEMTITPVRDATGTITNFAAIKQDVTERKWGEELRAATYRISELANSANGLEGFFRSTHEVIKGLMPATNFYVALHDEVAEILSFTYYVDETDEVPPPRPLNRGFTEYILRTGSPLLASREVLEELVKAAEVEVRGNPPLDRVGVPLKVEGRTFGALVVQTYTEGEKYGEKEKAALVFISEQAALAISRQWATEKARLLHDLTMAVGTSDDFSSALRVVVEDLPSNGMEIRPSLGA
jgi:PAS domain S-box-containing protein